MSRFVQIKDLFTKRNMYFLASFVVLVSCTFVLLVLLRDQSSNNLKASLINETSEKYEQDIRTQNANIKKIITSLNSLPQTANVINANEDIPETTKYLDKIFYDFNKDGLFENTSLVFSELKPENNYKIIDISLNIESTKENFFKLLEMIGKTGIYRGQATKLMDVSSVNLSFGSDDQEIITYALRLKIFFN